jgi:hypothetical protein
MINYLQHHEIDREKWDNCIRDSQRVMPYAFSWYLDIMAPGWEALIDDDYDSVFPVPSFRKFGIQYTATPPFTQQLGAFSPDKSVSKAINEFLDYMPTVYRLIDLCVGQMIQIDRFRVTLKANYQLDLSKPYEKLWNNFSAHCRRNIEKSQKKKPRIDDDITPGEIIELFSANRGKEISGIKPDHYQRLQNLISFCLRNDKGRVLGIRSPKGKLLHGIFLIEIKGSITMLLVANTPLSREKRHGYFVVNELIREYSSSRTILDFAGSSIPSVASFMESFGSKNVPFYRIYRNRLPWPLRLLK